MANVYKRTAVSTSAGGVGTTVGASTTIISAIPASTAGLIKSIRCTNGSGSAVEVSVFVRNSGNDFYLADAISVPANSSLNVVDSTVVLDVGDSVLAFSSVSIGVAAYWLETDN